MPPDTSSPADAYVPLPGLVGLLVSALWLAGMGQQAFLERRAFSWEGLLFSVLAVFIFTLAAMIANDPSGRLRFVTSMINKLFHGTPRQIAMLLSIGMTATLLQLLRARPPLTSYTWTLWLWVGAIVLYLFAISRPRTRPPQPWDLRKWWQANRLLVLVVAAILLAALALRAFWLDQIPPTLGGDEGAQGLEAIKVLQGRINNPFSTGWLSVPTMSFYFNSLTIQLFGRTMVALRLPWALVGTATVLSTFLLVRQLNGVPLALMTAGLLAAYHFHIHFSRLGSNQIADPLFVSLALLFLYRACDRGARMDWALCGVMTGLSHYFYAGARFTAVIIFALILYFALADRARFWRTHAGGVLAMIGAALITAAPMLQYAIRFPADYNARINLVGIFQSGWLEREQARLNKSALEILVTQFERAALAFNAYPDKTFWYGSPKPLFDFAEGVLFILGLGYASLRLADRRLVPMVFWWWGGMIMGGFLTENPPSTQRLVTLAVPAVFLVALALQQIGQILQRACGPSMVQRIIAPALAVAVLAIGSLSARWYFVEYTPLLIYGGPNSLVATAIGTYARDDLGPDWQLYFFGAPRMFIGFGSIPYLAPDVQGVDIEKPITAPLDPQTIAYDRHAAFIFLPERRAELEFVQQTFPHGEVQEFPSPLGGDPLFILYRVERTQLVAARRAR